jgi:hypothetical protein
MAAQWYCRLMGTELGPYTSQQLLEMARSHRITPDDSVKKGAEGMWVPADHVKGLFDASASSIIIASLPPDAKQSSGNKQPTAPAAAAEPRPITWYYISDQGKFGPLSFDELIVHGQEGRLKPKSRVWSSKSPKWCEAKDVKGLSFGS